MKIAGMIAILGGVLLSLNVFAQSTKVWTIPMPAGVQKIKLIRVSGDILATENCAKSCKALDVVKKKIKPKSLDKKSPLVGNPASDFCTSVEGIVRILRDEKGNEYDFCEFSDKSMIDTWQMMKAIKTGA